MTSSNSNLIGKTIGQFTILEEIGRGGMATVYSAMQNSMNRKVAIKVLPPHFLHDPGFLDRFVREVEVISHLEHPHILPIYEYGEVEGVPYIAMRYLGGGSMAQMIRRGVLPLEDIEKPFSQVCEALDYAHQQGIIHRDLKPGNIMLDESGNAYLSDFGIARVMGSNLTGSAIIGTPAYMAPEQAHGLAIDARADIYSMGVVLFELITGREPFQAETPMGLLLMHINEPLPPIGEFRADVLPEVQAVIERATMKNPDERFSSAGEMARAYRAALRGEAPATGARTKPQFDQQATLPPTKAANVGGTVIGGATDKVTPRGQVATRASSTQPGKAGAIPAAEPAESDLSPAPPRRSLLVWGAALVVLVALIGGGIFAATELLPGDETPVIVVPTPFRSAVTVSYNETYSISIPQRWMPIAAEFNDDSDATRLVHHWEAPDKTGFAVLAISEMSQADYIAQYYANRVDTTFIDEATAEDGTLRRSYRVAATTDDGFAPGQIDVFFRQQGPQLVVLEVYTADRVAADSVTLTTLQLILDSLRVTAPTVQG